MIGDRTHHGFARNMKGVRDAGKRLAQEGYDLLYGDHICGYILYIEEVAE